MEFSIIICTHNRAAFLRRCLASIQAQEGVRGDYEIVVVANACTDSTVEVAETFARSCAIPVRCLEEPRAGLSRARNLGAHAARGRWFVYLDDDAEATPGWLADYEAYLGGNPGVDAAGGPIRPDWGSLPKPPYWVPEFNCHVGELSLPDTAREFPPGTFPFGGNMLIGRQAFERVGEFDLTFGLQGGKQVMGEEGQWFLRHASGGRRPGYASGAVICHWVNPARITRSSILARSWHSGVAQGRHGELHPALPGPLRWIRHATSAALHGRLSLAEQAYLARWLGYIVGRAKG